MGGGSPCLERREAEILVQFFFFLVCDHPEENPMTEEEEEEWGWVLDLFLAFLLKETTACGAADMFPPHMTPPSPQLMLYNQKSDDLISDNWRKLQIPCRASAGSPRGFFLKKNDDTHDSARACTLAIRVCVGGDSRLLPHQCLAHYP